MNFLFQLLNFSKLDAYLVIQDGFLDKQIDSIVGDFVQHSFPILMTINARISNALRFSSIQFNAIGFYFSS